jgi:hypothetical protein
MSSNKCPSCARLNFSDSAACHSCGADLDGGSSRRWRPRPDAFQKQSASFQHDWSSSSSPGAAAAREPRASLLAGEGAIAPSETTDNLIRVVVMCLLLLVSLKFGGEWVVKEKSSKKYYNKNATGWTRLHSKPIEDNKPRRERPRWRSRED